MTNGDTPATKKDLERLESKLDQSVKDLERLDSKLDQSVQQLRAEASHNYNDLVERITDSETRLLKAFYSFAETSQKRLDAMDRNDVGVKDRLSALETRLTEVEKRLNMPRSN